MNENTKMHVIIKTKNIKRFNVRCYAIAVFAMGLCLCLSVCLYLSQIGVLSKQLNGSSWFSATGLPSTCHTLCYKEIVLTPKIRHTSSGTTDFEDFATASRSCTLSTVELVDHTCDGR